MDHDPERPARLSDVRPYSAAVAQAARRLLGEARQGLRQRQPSDGATWVRIASMTCAL